MAEQKERKIWKIRTVKNYPQAHNHLFIGEVIQLTSSYVRLSCRTYHFSKVVNSVKDIKTGSESVRILPWNRIEVINELPVSFNYSEAKLTSSKDGKIVLNDGQMYCVLASSYDNRY
jgi:hypothetical protein